jgi:hypothetical protein
MSVPQPPRVTPVVTHVPEITNFPQPSDFGAVPVRTEVRLRVRPSTAVRCPVDGAWWPRSHEPTAEFPGLILAMSSWVGPVRRVDYSLDDWSPTTQSLTVEGWLVSLAGSSMLQRNTVAVTGTNQRQMCLLVIPPGTPGDVARAVLHLTAGSHAVGTVAEIFADHGIVQDSPHPHL